MPKAKISEIFESFQGEGPYLGLRQVFVRFFGCNLRCAFCDTPLSVYGDYTVSDLRAALAPFQGYHSLCLTGGEPLLQADFLKAFLKNREDLKTKIYLETNGVLFKELAQILENVDIIAMDFKLPSVSKNRSFWQEHEKFLTLAQGKDVFVKMVVGRQTRETDIAEAAHVVRRVNPETEIVLQPNWFELDAALLSLCEFLKNKILASGLGHVKILPQAHKVAGIR